MLLMVEKGIREQISHSIYQYAKANNKYMKNYNKKKNFYVFDIGTQMIYMVGQCRKSLQ